MRYCAIAVVVGLMAGCAGPEINTQESHVPVALRNDYSFDQSLGALRRSNMLVDKAIDDHEMAVIEAERYYRDAINKTGRDATDKAAAVMAEYEKKLGELKTACVEKLRRAAAISRSANKKEEAAAIIAIADRIAAAPDNGRFTDTDYLFSVADTKPSEVAPPDGVFEVHWTLHAGNEMTLVFHDGKWCLGQEFFDGVATPLSPLGPGKWRVYDKPNVLSEIQFENGNWSYRQYQIHGGEGKEMIVENQGVLKKK